MASPERIASSARPDSASAISRREPATIKVLGIATQGAGSTDEARLRAMLIEFDAEVLQFHRRARMKMLREIVRTIRSRKYEVVALEGTGIAGGVGAMIGRITAGVPYVVSTGDAIAPFLRRLTIWSAPFAGIYERALCGLSAGVIGWTPYLVGRALTLGARRAITVPGWAPFPRTREQLETARREIRSKLRIASNAIVFGIAGSLMWTERVQYSYGLELVQAMAQVRRDDVVALIVGDGTAAQRLRELAGNRLGKSVLMPGRVAQSMVPDYLAAMDVGSIPQSVDGVGSFRYTTKLSEYVSVGLPVVTGQTPLGYEFGDDWLWRLAGDAPWDARYVSELTQLMETVTREEIADKSNCIGRLSNLFDKNEQVRRVTSFISELCANSDSRIGR